MSSLSSSLPSDTAATSTSADNHAAPASTRALRGGETHLLDVCLAADQDTNRGVNGV